MTLKASPALNAPTLTTAGSKAARDDDLLERTHELSPRDDRIRGAMWQRAVTAPAHDGHLELNNPGHNAPPRDGDGALELVETWIPNAASPSKAPASIQAEHHQAPPRRAEKHRRRCGPLCRLAKRSPASRGHMRVMTTGMRIRSL